MTSLTTRGLGTFLGLYWRMWLELFVSLPPCLEPETSGNLLELRIAPASQNKHTVCLCREPFLRSRHRCAVSDDRIFHARFHLLQHPGSRPIELSEVAPDGKTPLGPGHAVSSFTQIDVTAVRVFQSLPHRRQLAMFPPSVERLQQSDEQVVPQPTLFPSVSDGSPTQSTVLP